MFRLLATFALAGSVLFQAQAALVANCDRNATVVAGDTCDGISAKHSVSTYQLATVNTGIIDAKCDNLQIGQVVCLGITGQDCQAIHVVQSGDDCGAIVKMHNISTSTLLKNNPNVNQQCTNLYAGEVLCVSDIIYVGSTTPTSASAASSAASTSTSSTCPRVTY